MRCSMVAFDKTGTLTEGRPALVAAEPARGSGLTREALSGSPRRCRRAASTRWRAPCCARPGRLKRDARVAGAASAARAGRPAPGARLMLAIGTRRVRCSWAARRLMDEIGAGAAAPLKRRADGAAG